eukprot:CAMPEP_0119469498 /NCGR_PEP_ID=MMETSP1344-20130328/2797_1 /TAXON_ID=236787 /ORGANISM="Florenciella parvula, Strain CCMP2471" /LENGTH=305 /DNA_ID=CAMNT_0007502061 /DNA_START=235 /DNA_END=1149 /DNA_ORIENTATION=-
MVVRVGGSTARAGGGAQQGRRSKVTISKQNTFTPRRKTSKRAVEARARTWKESFESVKRDVQMLRTDPLGIFVEIYERNQEREETFRLSLKFYLTNSFTGLLWWRFLDVMATLSCILYIAQTYNEEPVTEGIFDTNTTTVEYWSEWESEDESKDWAKVAGRFTFAESVVSGFFMLNFVLHFYVSDQPWRDDVWMDTNHFIELITTVPLVYLHTMYKSDGSKLTELDRVRYQNIHEWPLGWGVEEFIIYCMFGLRTLRILRILRLKLIIDIVDNDVQRKIGELVLYMLTMTLFCAGLLQYLEHSDP